VTDAAIAAQIHEPLDVHRDFAPQVTFDREAPEELTQLRDFGLAEILDGRSRIDLCGPACLQSAASADAENMRQRNRNVLVDGYVYASDTCHRKVPLALPLLVPRIAADDAHDASAANDFAVPTDLAYRCPDLHGFAPSAARPAVAAQIGLLE
jgi:hypothetical protein